MAQYNTKQRKLLLEHLSEHPDELLSAHQIAEALQDKKISLGTVYRALSQLEIEKKVRRSVKTGTRDTFYQYIAAETCKHALHMSCTKCGKTFHMAAENAASLTKSLEKNEKFTLDTNVTVLYGICAACRT